PLTEIVHVDLTRTPGPSAGAGLLAGRPYPGIRERRPHDQAVGPETGLRDRDPHRAQRLGPRRGVLPGQQAPRLGELGRRGASLESSGATWGWRDAGGRA